MRQHLIQLRRAIVIHAAHSHRIVDLIAKIASIVVIIGIIHGHIRGLIIEHHVSRLAIIVVIARTTRTSNIRSHRRRWVIGIIPKYEKLFKNRKIMFYVGTCCAVESDFSTSSASHY